MVISVSRAPVWMGGHAKTSLSPTLAHVHLASLAGTVRLVSGRLVSWHKIDSNEWDYQAIFAELPKKMGSDAISSPSRWTNNHTPLSLVSKLNQPLTPCVTPLWRPKMGLFFWILKTAAKVFSLCEDRAQLLSAETRSSDGIGPLSRGFWFF